MRFTISSTSRPAILCSRSVSFQALATGKAAVIERSVNAEIVVPLTRTARLAGRNRLPPHESQVTGDM